MFILMLLSAVLIELPARAQIAGREITAGENEPQNGANPELSWLARDKFDRVRFMSDISSSHYIFYSPNSQSAPSYIFFPPVPPPLDSEIPLLAPIDSGPPAPQELAAFVGEIFYSLLGARLASDDLPKALRAKIVAYRDAKTALQREMRSRILVLKDVDADSRERQLASLAALQAPRIANVELMAEELRSDLRPTRVLGLPIESPDPNERSSWRVHSVRDAPSTPAGLRKEAGAICSAAFYQDGLSSAQRRLLREAAIDLETEANPANSAGQTGPGLRLISFSPEPARIAIPANLQPELEKKINEFLSAKNALKAELRDAFQNSDEASGGARREAMSKLAAAQAPRFAALEALAEDIRRDLAALPNPKGPPLPLALPQELTSRISAYRKHKLELLKTLRAMLVAPSPISQLSHDAAGARPNDLGQGAQAWLHDSASTTEVQSLNLRVSVAEFDRLQADLIAALNKEEAGIRESLAEYVRAANGPADRKSINDLLKDFEGARQQQEIWDRYRDYQTAALMPGLSAGQRCVLFDAGVEQLDLPLPTGERVN